MGMIIFDDENMFNEEVLNRGGALYGPQLRNVYVPTDFQEENIKTFLKDNKVDTADCIVLLSKKPLLHSVSYVCKVWSAPML